MFPPIAPIRANIIDKDNVIVLGLKNIYIDSTFLFLHYLKVVGNKSMATVVTTLLAMLTAAIYTADKTTAVRVLLARYIEQAVIPQTTPRIATKYELDSFLSLR